MMIACPVCRSPARPGRCPFCGTAIRALAVALITLSTASAEPARALYGPPPTDNDGPGIPLAAPELDTGTKAARGLLSDSDIAMLTAASATELNAALLLEENAMVKGDDRALAAALIARSKLQPSDPQALYKLTLLVAQGGDCGSTLGHAKAALVQLPLWKETSRLNREISLRKIAATCQQTLTPGSAEAIEAAKAYVKAAVEGGVRVSDEIKELSQK